MKIDSELKKIEVMKGKLMEGDGLERKIGKDRNDIMIEVGEIDSIG